MDQIQRDKIAAKLKKIKALAERGVGGEKETAMRMYEDLKARYELEDEEIMLDAVTLHWFGYADELEERVLRWIFYKVTGDASYHIYTGKYSRRKKRGCDCTEIEAAEITLLYNFYKEELKRELEAFLVAFRCGNDLYPDETARCYKENDVEAPERTDEEKQYKVTDAEIEKAAAVPVDISEIDLKKFWGIAFQLAAVAKTLQEETDICTACPYTYTDEQCTGCGTYWNMRDLRLDFEAIQQRLIKAATEG